MIKLLCFLAPMMGFTQAEILLIGTAHDIPEEVAHNYTPILEIATAWQPEIICTESRKPKDTLSLVNIYGANIFTEMDSVATSWQIQETDKAEAIASLYQQLEIKEDLYLRMQLRNLLYVSMDRGNAYFQNYLIYQTLQALTAKEQENFKLKFPMYADVESYIKRNAYDEYTLVVFPLADSLQTPYLYSTDDQTLSVPYHTTWDNAFKELEGTPHLDKWEKIKEELKTIFEKSLQKDTGLLTINTNEFQEKVHELEYSAIEFGINEQADLMSFYWGERNERMSQHILTVARKNPNKKIIVFYGISHIHAIRRKLKAASDHTILTLPDLDNWKNYENRF